MLKIILADDHVLIRYGLKQVILEEYKDAIIYEAGNGREVFRIVNEHPVDIVVLDITMPASDGIDVLIELKKVFPKLAVLILSMHPEERFAVRALKSGAHGYLTKASAPDEINQAIRKILSGGKYIPASLGELLANNLLEYNEEKRLSEILSNREYQIFLMLATGKSVGECALEVSLNINTVSTYRARILEKMNLKTNAELIRYAIDHSLID